MCVQCLPTKTILAIAKTIIGSESAKSAWIKQAVQLSNRGARIKCVGQIRKYRAAYEQRAKRLLRNNDTDSENESLQSPTPKQQAPKK